MNAETIGNTPATTTPSGLRWPQVVLIVVATIAVTAGLTYWVLSQTLFLKEFTPVQLKSNEEQVLNRKLRAIGLRCGTPRQENP